MTAALFYLIETTKCLVVLASIAGAAVALGFLLF
jgi:hypothetical protein